MRPDPSGPGDSASDLGAFGPGRLSTTLGPRGTRLLVAALLATLMLWNVPFGSYLLYPFKLFATWLHELSHGIAMLVLGAGVRKMEIFRDTSGLAFPERGVTALAQGAISSAGYMGTAAFGALFLLLGQTERGARAVLGILGATMLATAALFVRNGFGVGATLVGGMVLVGVAVLATETIQSFVLNFLAAQACINAVLDIRVLFGQTMLVNGQSHGQTDAHTVARVLGGPHWMWASLWLAWSFVLFYLALRRLGPKGRRSSPRLSRPQPAQAADGSAPS